MTQWDSEELLKTGSRQPNQLKRFLKRFHIISAHLPSLPSGLVGMSEKFSLIIDRKTTAPSPRPVPTSCRYPTKNTVRSGAIVV
jgi:hypothetical protein